MEEAPMSYIMVWLAPWLGAVLVLLMHRVGGRAKGLVGVASLLVSAIFSTLLLQRALASEEPLHFAAEWVPSLGVTVGYYADALAAIMAFVVAWLSFLIAVYSLEYMGHDPGQTRYWFFFTFFVGSMEFLVLADNLVAMFIGWEGTGLASYALIGHWFTDEEDKWVGDPGRKALGIPMWFEPSHSGLRALVFTRLGDVGFLVGIAVLHIMLGTTSLEAMAANPAGWAALLASKGILAAFLAFFIMGALAKSAQFPFHEWLVTAMTGPTSVSALIHAATMVKAGVYFLLRVTPILAGAASALRVTSPEVYHTIEGFFAWIAIIGGFTAFMMATMALVSRELKLILAFSTASQLGYMFLATAAGALTGTAALGVFAGLSHLVSHAVFKASLFLAAGAIIHAVHSRFIDDMGGLAAYMPATFIAMLLASLSLAGLPPFMGFWTKDTVLHAAHEAHAQVAFMLGFITALLTAAYTMRMVLRVFLYEPSNHVAKHPPHEAGKLMLVPYALLAVISLAGGALWPKLEEGFAEVLSEKTLGLGTPLHLEPSVSLMAASVGMVVAGLGVSFYVYHILVAKPMEFISRIPILYKLHTFLYDRWFINAIYYRVVVDGLKALSRAIYNYIDQAVVDNLYHRFLPWAIMGASSLLWKTLEHWIDTGFHVSLVNGVLSFSDRVRRMQTGILNHYILFLWLGLTVMLVLITWLAGW